MSPSNIALNIVVVGGGICGLSCAIGLRRAGHHVTVYEKYDAEAETGAGIVLKSNGTRVLSQWGLDLVAEVGAAKYREGVIADGKTLRVLRRIHAEGGPDDETRPTIRSDLRKVLRTEAERQDLTGGGTIKLVHATEVVDYDPEQPAVQLGDGSWQQADLVVACDGIKSKAIKKIVGSDSPATATGFSAFRLLLPSKDLEEVADKYRENEFIADTFEKGSGKTWFAVERGGRIFTWRKTHFDQLHAFDIVIPDNERYVSSEDWFAKCDKSVLLEEFGHWHPIFNELLQTAEDPLLWKICDREPLEVLHRGRLCMFGDALHPMGPYRAQGGTMAIEDAGVLEVCFTGIHDVSEIKKRLELLQALRLPRYSSAQMGSTVRQDEPNHDQRLQEVLQICKKYFPEGTQTLLDDNTGWETWLLRYDARSEAKAFVSKEIGREI